MTRQYLAGELSLLLARVQDVTTTEAAARDTWVLRHAAETMPVSTLGVVTMRALALAEILLLGLAVPGDAAAFIR